MKKKDAKTDASRAAALSAVMAAALLFLSVVLARSAVIQLRTGQVLSGCVSIAGTVLFFLVSLIMLNDLRKNWQNKTQTQEDHPNGP